MDVARPIPLDRLVFGTHDMDWKYVVDWRGAWHLKPIKVEAEPDGRYYVCDGRHRATAAYEDGATHIWAHVA